MTFHKSSEMFGLGNINHMKKQDQSFDRKARLAAFALVFKILTKSPQFIILTKIA